MEKREQAFKIHIAIMWRQGRFVLISRIRGAEGISTYILSVGFGGAEGISTSILSVGFGSRHSILLRDGFYDCPTQQWEGLPR